MFQFKTPVFGVDKVDLSIQGGILPAHSNGELCSRAYAQLILSVCILWAVSNEKIGFQFQYTKLSIFGYDF